MVKTKPNVLLITTDQHRKDAIGCYNNQVVKTENIDKLAKNGVLFENCFTQSSVCAPSRATIATGRYPNSHHLRFNGISLPKSEKTMMQVFLESGYDTAAFGKMHFEPQCKNIYSEGLSKELIEEELNRPPIYTGENWYGFNYFEISEDSRIGLYGDFLKDNGFDWHDDLFSGDIGQWKAFTSKFPEEFYQTSWIANRTINYIKENRTKPFFIWASFVDPHPPFNVPSPYDRLYNPCEMSLPKVKEGELEMKPRYFKNLFYGNYKEAQIINTDYSKFKNSDWQKIKAFYYGKVSLIDKNIGKIIAVLKEKNFIENTLIIFTSDHGEGLGDNFVMYKGPPHYDHVINVPLIINFSKKLKPIVIGELVQLTDIMSTVLDVCNLKAPEGVQGKSLYPSLMGNNKRYYDEIYTEYLGDPRVLTIRDKKFRYSLWVDDDSEELYSLNDDPYQFINLANELKFKNIREDMRKRLLLRIINDRDPLPKRSACW